MSNVFEIKNYIKCKPFIDNEGRGLIISDRDVSVNSIAISLNSGVVFSVDSEMEANTINEDSDFRKIEAVPVSVKSIERNGIDVSLITKTQSEEIRRSFKDVKFIFIESEFDKELGFNIPKLNNSGMCIIKEIAMSTFNKMKISADTLFSHQNRHKTNIHHQQLNQKNEIIEFIL